MDNAQLEITLSDLQKLRDRYRDELETLPEGYLTAMPKGNSQRFYQNLTVEGKRTRQGITHKKGTVFALARKRYLQEAMATLNHNIKVLTRAIENYLPFDQGKILDSLPGAYQSVPRDAFYDPLTDPGRQHNDNVAQRIASHAEWGRQPYKRADYKREELRLTSRRGIPMRSKTEVILANELDANGVYYHYEQPLYLDPFNMWVIPDFTLEGAGGELFYIELFGLMNDESYAMEQTMKLQRYVASGIVPGINLVCLFEADNRLDLRRIEALVQLEVIPRL